MLMKSTHAIKKLILIVNNFKIIQFDFLLNNEIRRRSEFSESELLNRRVRGSELVLHHFLSSDTDANIDDVTDLVSFLQNFLRP
jgi:hypothetical protein